jgi:small subunit ribosomal protein S9
MADNDDETSRTDVDEPELSEYTTETRRPVARPSPQAVPPPLPVRATGRRKQAIARVRIVPGTGEWKINGRTLENYFPNKVHQQIVNEPLKVLELDGAYDVLVRVHGGGPPARPARSASASPAPSTGSTRSSTARR